MKWSGGCGPAGGDRRDELGEALPMAHVLTADSTNTHQRNEPMTKVLYVYGSSAGPNGRKYLALSGQQDFEVLGPELPFPSWKPRSLSELLRWVG